MSWAGRVYNKQEEGFQTSQDQSLHTDYDQSQQICLHSQWVKALLRTDCTVVCVGGLGRIHSTSAMRRKMPPSAGIDCNNVLRISWRLFRNLHTHSDTVITIKSESYLIMRSALKALIALKALNTLNSVTDTLLFCSTRGEKRSTNPLTTRARSACQEQNDT